MKKMRFQNFIYSGFLEAGEDILFVCRKHIWVHRKPLTREFILGIVVPLFFYFLYPPLLVVWGGWLFIGLLRFLYQLTDWYYDAWLVTTVGIIDVEWNGFFSKSSNRIEYQTIDGISYAVDGFWQTVLNFGLVQIQQIGGTTLVNMDDAYNPKRIEREILRIHQRVVSDKTRNEHEALKQILTSLVQTTIKK